MTVTADVVDWRDEALCAQVDPELFFPKHGGSAKPAKRICRACPVCAECGQWALDNEVIDYGVFGGMVPKERRILAGRGKAAKTVNSA